MKEFSDRLTATETQPLCLRVLETALVRVEVEMRSAAEAERQLWAKFGIPWEKSELWRALSLGNW